MPAKNLREGKRHTSAGAYPEGIEGAIWQMVSESSGQSHRNLHSALLGCGHVSFYHLRAWAQIPEAAIVALANRTVTKAEDRAREFGIRPEWEPRGRHAHAYVGTVTVNINDRSRMIETTVPYGGRHLDMC
jgi:hypothetical protein